MAHIDLEAVLPNQYNVANLDHPLAQDQAHYANKFHLHDGNSPNFYNVNDDGYGWSNEFGNQARTLESLFRGIFTNLMVFLTYFWGFLIHFGGFSLIRGLFYVLTKLWFHFPDL